MLTGEPDRTRPSIDQTSECHRKQGDDVVERCVHDLVNEQVSRQPERIALACAGDELTYRDLDHRSERWACLFAARGIGAEARVGVCLDRSTEAVIVFLGVLKAGAAYVPLDPDQPAERLRHIATDAGLSVVVTRRDLLDGTFADLVPTLLPECEHERVRFAPIGVTSTLPDQLACVMYTSGSTGLPKGVAVTHRGVVSLVTGQDLIRFDPGEVILQLAPLVFDASTLEIWGALANGARLAIFPERTPSPSSIAAAVRAHGVTTLHVTAGLLQRVADEQLHNLGGLRQFIAGGDVLSAKHVRRVLHELPACTFIAAYGPTESTTLASAQAIQTDEQLVPSVPLGRPFANRQAYVLGHDLSPVATGAAGELYVGGEGLARGYLGQPGLTATRFIPNPFGSPGSRLYRTGDLARWQIDGTLEFLGRIDNQVKVRGYRIEVAEVEAALARQPQVRSAVVGLCGESAEDKRLVAYVVPPEAAAHDGRDLRRGLERELPSYMVPSLFVGVEAMPLTPSGKLDRQALPAAPERPAQLATDAPRGRTEQILARIWCEVLEVTQAGRNEDFFELGGHSLSAMRVLAEVERELGPCFSIDVLLERPSIAAFAAEIAVRCGHTSPASSDGSSQ